MHGEFTQAAGAHARGMGCFRCAADVRANRTRRTLAEFIERSALVHGNRYDYSLVDYRNTDVAVEIVCRVHGSFMQAPASHMNGSGCIKCSSTGPSVPEMEIAAALIDLGFDIKHSDRKLIHPYELDIVVPADKLAIEYNGFYWHCDLNREPGYSKMKHDMALAAGVDLLTIWEFDWKRQRTRRVWQRILAERLRLGAPAAGLPAFKIDAEQATNFLRKHHLRAISKFDVAFGLILDGRIASVLTLRHRRGNEWGVGQWASSLPMSGAEERLFAHATSSLGADIVWSLQERETSKRSILEGMGFEKHDEIPPQQRVWFPKIGLRPGSYWRPENIPKIMESVPVSKRRDAVSVEEMTEFQDHIRARRIYDAGHIWWVWRR